MQPAACSMCLLVTTINFAKTAIPIELPLGLWTRVGSRNHVLGWGLDQLGNGRGQIWQQVMNKPTHSVNFIDVL